MFNLQAITKIFRPARDTIGTRWSKAPAHGTVPAHVFNALRDDAITVQRGAGQNRRYTAIAKKELEAMTVKASEARRDAVLNLARAEYAEHELAQSEARIKQLEQNLNGIVEGVTLYDYGSRSFQGARQIKPLLEAARRIKREQA